MRRNNFSLACIFFTIAALFQMIFMPYTPWSICIYFVLYFLLSSSIECPWQLHSHFAIEWSLHRVSKEKSCKLFYTLFVIYLIQIWINSANPKKDRYRASKKKQKNKIMIKKTCRNYDSMRWCWWWRNNRGKKNIKKHLRWCHWIVKIKLIRCLYAWR